MDAVLELQKQTKHVLDEQASDLIKTYKVAQTLGLDTSRMIERLSGTFPINGTRGRGPAARRGTARRVAGRTGHRPTDEQILTALPANQSALARKFGVSRQTISKRLDVLAKSGAVMPQGEGTRKMWHPAAPVSPVR